MTFPNNILFISNTSRKMEDIVNTVDLKNMDSDEILIHLVSQYSVLWDSSLTEYRSHVDKNKAWQEIAESMNIEDQILQKDWLRLRTRWSREMKNEEILPRGSCWPHFDSLLFLKPFVRQRRTVKSRKKYLNRSLFPKDDISGSEVSNPTCYESNNDSYSGLSESSSSESSSSKHIIDEQMLSKITNAIKKLSPKKKTTKNEEFGQTIASMLDKLPILKQLEVRAQILKLLVEESTEDD